MVLEMDSNIGEKRFSPLRKTFTTTFPKFKDIFFKTKGYIDVRLLETRNSNYPNKLHLRWKRSLEQSNKIQQVVLGAGDISV